MNNAAFAVDSNNNISMTIHKPTMATIENTAKMFGFSNYMIRQKVLSGEIVAVKCGSRYLVNIDKFVEYLNSNRINGNEPAPVCGIKPISVKI